MGDKIGSGGNSYNQDNASSGPISGNNNIYPFMMNRNPTLIIWNIRGATNVAFRGNMKDLLNTHTPCILALLETKMESHEFLKNEYNFTGMVESPATGRSGVSLFYGMRINLRSLA
ncbi:hypothetical protein RDI58_028952 [Solanum bulbocastanum]|uniref:Uncharacterized protein n=1 Tax=Solanum bulbocastanum TaxID=147425 RepID=A0AAN8SPK9_SOLBU